MTPDKLHLVAITSLLLACNHNILNSAKYDELDDNIPMIKDFQRITRGAFSWEEVVGCEADLLSRLNWNLVVLTPLHFMYSCLGMGIVSEIDRQCNQSKDHVKANKENSSSIFEESQTLIAVDPKTLRSVRKYAEFFADLSA